MKLITIEENQWLQLRQEIQFIKAYIQEQSQSTEIIDSYPLSTKNRKNSELIPFYTFASINFLLKR